jgi:CheY-like chemotaxis protein
MNKVLVIDDSDAWYSAVENELGKQGCTVVRARHQDQAISAATDEQPDLVIIDLLLATRAGAGFVRRLRSLPNLKNIPMVLTSSGTGQGAVTSALGPQAQDVIPKNAKGLGTITDRLRKLPVSA